MKILTLESGSLDSRLGLVSVLRFIYTRVKAKLPEQKDHQRLWLKEYRALFLSPITVSKQVVRAGKELLLVTVIQGPSTSRHHVAVPLGCFCCLRLGYRYLHVPRPDTQEVRKGRKCTEESNSLVLRPS